MTFEDMDFIQQVRIRLCKNPDLVPDLMLVLGAAALDWSARRSYDSSRAETNAYLGMLAALELDLTDPDPNASVGGLARQVAIGMGINRRRPQTVREQELAEFVRRADRRNPDEAADHYAQLGEPPVPQRDKDYEP